MADFEGVTNPLKFGRKIRCLGWEDKTRFMFLLRGHVIRDVLHQAYGEPGTDPKPVNNILIEHRGGEFYPARVDDVMLKRTDWAVVPMPPKHKERK